MQKEMHFHWWNWWVTIVTGTKPNNGGNWTWTMSSLHEGDLVSGNSLSQGSGNCALWPPYRICFPSPGAENPLKMSVQYMLNICSISFRYPSDIADIVAICCLCFISCHNHWVWIIVCMVSPVLIWSISHGFVSKRMPPNQLIIMFHHFPNTCTHNS